MLTYENCTLCPRSCGADRLNGGVGYCKMPAQLRAAKAMLHYGEEPCICGDKPTGAVFFSGCTLGCKYCQNAEISLSGKGAELDSVRLREIFLELIEQGAGSIDLVTPTQFLPQILPALTPKLPVPVVYNCGGYEKAETLRELEGLVDVYLPDFKYSDNVLAKQLSGAGDYLETCREALSEMYRQTGSPQYKKGQMVRGILVRHLVLPGHLNNTYGVLDELARLFPKKDIPVSLMSQYVPMGSLPAPLDRRLTEEEYASAVSWMELCGLRLGFTQELEAATTDLLPDFNLEGI